ncbi:sensor histidine kinase [Nonomuraea glycinis]|uniref:histidine kinase n=1 Tax=Nonomuraea glycinis TaxID=2047744 RepID=A0A918AF28_9ACTN|nr:sensor histidine kinase [Nonomuraea glycinis]MCA2182712.1 sensor histidine kinase [Nonomuraea glycinis]GGP17332.1 two-component sensor histidine kinase [Nonomuraea glycinis]
MRRVPPTVVDAVLAIGCFLSIMIMAVLNHRLDGWVAALAAVNTLPLLWRRRFPLLVSTMTGIGTGALFLTDSMGGIPAASLIATYGLASLSPPTRMLIGVLCTIAGFASAAVLQHHQPLSYGSTAAAFVVAYALGSSARARRDRIAVLEERARRLAEEREVAAVRERERIAREMHDIVAHAMSLVILQAEGGPVALRTDPAKAERIFDTISTTTRDGLSQLRRVLLALRSEEAERHPKPGIESVPSLVEGVRQAGLDATFEERGEPRPCRADLAVTVYRMVQEALSNTIKHAGATRVRVRITWRDDALDLEVHDDGRGVSAAPGQGGHGLIGMRERVAVAGGRLVTGSDGTGFHVAASLPLGGGPTDAGPLTEAGPPTDSRAP